ncbi:helix-turn-helix domain-containing protein [Francisella adeliensis]|uniref:HTH luxR-type domain-containing protein n=1 Tax=Francisella adeliensis TaxID=2007306 RepID=A0A2Z4Y1G3_9GAMM|nr:helix-turn-helix transcriptional regulator [Francisella adeliensis]AXA34572.1 hypothetical protein CDH04_09270 [Francisella adeliensis]
MDKLEIPYFICDDKYKIVYVNSNFENLNLNERDIENQLDFSSLNNDVQYLECSKDSNDLFLKMKLIEQEKKFFHCTLENLDLDMVKNEIVGAEELMSNLSVGVYIKDIFGVYAYSNDIHREFIFSKSLNKTDFDITSSAYAEEIRANDQKTKESLTMSSFYEKYLIDEKIYTYLTMKIFHKNYIYGFIINLHDIQSFLLEKDRHIYGCISEIVQNNKELLHWVVEGKSSSEIATIMNLSTKSIEFKLSKIKKKLNCQKISELSYLVGKYYTIFES